MSQNKKSFFLYNDQYELVKELSIEQRGALLTAIFEHVCTGKYEISLDGMTKIASKVIIMQIDRDCEKWSQYIEKQSENGKKGGRPKQSQKTQAFFEKPKKADTVTVTVTDTDNVTDTVTDTDTEKERKREAAEAARGKYAFNGEVVKIDYDQMMKWDKSFKFINVLEHLKSIDKTWAARKAEGEDVGKRWFWGTMQALVNANSERAAKGLDS